MSCLDGKTLDRLKTLSTEAEAIERKLATDLVIMTTIHSGSLNSDRWRNYMEVFWSELARKGYSPHLNDCATKPSLEPSASICGLE